tara:strand:- start:1537 stop:2139 length:603 start_codon:yes stop_codon:yes gene_type:complete
MKWLNDRQIIYRRDPINDKPTIETDTYRYYEQGTHECYTLFNTSAKIPTYKSLKWHFLVLYYLNSDILSPEEEIITLFKFIAKKENGFVTFFISKQKLEEIIQNVLTIGGEPPINRKRKIIFKDFTGLSTKEKLSIVGKLIGRSSIDKEMIYETMLDLNDWGKKITISRIAGLLNCSVRTIHRNMGDELKREKVRLNEEI